MLPQDWESRSLKHILDLYYDKLDAEYDIAGIAMYTIVLISMHCLVFIELDNRYAALDILVYYFIYTTD